MVAVCVFVLLAGATVAGAFDTLGYGDDGTGWIGLITVVGACAGLACALRSWWALLGPVAVTGAIVATADDVLSALAATLLLPPLLLFMAAAVRRARRGVPGWSAAVLLAVAAVPVIVGIADRIRREGARLPEAVAQQIDADLSLANLCTGAGTPPRLRASLLQGAEALLRELRDRPDATLEYTFFYEEGDERALLTVREVAEEQLADLQRNGCARDLRQRLARAL